MYPLIDVTLGAQNSGPRVGPLVISEVMYDPPDPDGAGPVDARNLEFVEIYNPTAQLVELRNWTLGSGIDFSFAPDTTIDAEGTLVVVRFDPTIALNSDLLQEFRSYFGIDESVSLVGGFDGALNNAGERIQLLRPDMASAGRTGLFPGPAGGSSDVRRCVALAGRTLDSW